MYSEFSFLVETARVIPPGRGGGGYSWEFLVGVCHTVLQILTRFSTPVFRLDL